MAPFSKKLSYKNADKLMEKLIEILWGILEDKQIEHKFDIENSVFAIAEQEIAIQS